MTEEIIIDEFTKSTWNLLEEIKKLQDENKDLREDIHRLEQENKALNFKINQLKANGLYNDLTGIELSAKVVELEQENKELKNKVEKLENKLQLRMASDKESDAFWDEIFSEKDYPFNKENAYKELKDYYFVLEQLPKIYMEITGGTLSKTTYFASSVIEAYNDALSRYYDEIDDLEYNNAQYKTTLEEIRNITKDAYENDNEYQATGVYTEITDKINEVLQQKVDLGFWDKEGNYKEDIQKVDSKDL